MPEIRIWVTDLHLHRHRHLTKGWADRRDRSRIRTDQIGGSANWICRCSMGQSGWVDLTGGAWEHRRRPVRCWEDLKFVILRQFRSLKAGSLFEQWLAIKQTGSVLDYQHQFIAFSAPLTGVTEEVAMGQFITGLKSDIKVEIRVLGPRSLDQAMELAIKLEDKLHSTSLKPTYAKNTQLPFNSQNRSQPLSLTSHGTFSSEKSTPPSFKPIRQMRRGASMKKKELSIILAIDDDDEVERDHDTSSDDELQT
ncbi:hypothetical protein LXL04_019378 [Taraxacum kok-saghyz]